VSEGLAASPFVAAWVWSQSGVDQRVPLHIASLVAAVLAPEMIAAVSGFAGVVGGGRHSSSIGCNDSFYSQSIQQGNHTSCFHHSEGEDGSK
jgi:hypothetical protein